MEISDGAIVEGHEAGYPFADLSRLRTDAGAFMQRVLSEDQEDEMEEDEPRHVITPDYACFASTKAHFPPQTDHHGRPINADSHVPKNSGKSNESTH